MIKEAYCSYEVSKLLKEKGFNEQCSSTYDIAVSGGKPIFYKYDALQFFPNGMKNSDDKYGMVISAPTHQMTMAWLRDVHNIFIDVHLSFAENPEVHPAVYYVYILDTKSGNSLLEKATSINELNPLIDVSNHNVPINFDSPEKAVEAALKYVLKNLI